MAPLEASANERFDLTRDAIMSDPDPITLEDRLDALKSWLLNLRADPFVHTRPEAIAEIDLHLAAVDDALETLQFAPKGFR